MNGEEMDSETTGAPRDGGGRRFGWLQVLGLLVAVVLATVLVTVWAVKTVLFPSEFRPVTLSTKEERVLDAKLERLDPLRRGPRVAGTRRRQASPESEAVIPLQPEPYSEEGARREIDLSEREINALLAKNTDLAHKLAIDLADDLVSAKLLVPVDEDFPVFGGRTLKVRAGVGLAYENERPVVVLKGISVMGVPLPNAWLGGIKNIDLVRELGTEEGFWNAFADGVEAMQVEEGKLKIRLKE